MVVFSTFSMLHIMTALCVASGQVFSDDQKAEEITNKGVAPDHNAGVAWNDTKRTSFDDVDSRWTSGENSLRNGGHGDLFIETSPDQGESTDVFQARHSDVGANPQNDLTHADILNIAQDVMSMTDNLNTAQGVMPMTDAPIETKWNISVPLNQTMDRGVSMLDNLEMEHGVNSMPDILDMEHGVKPMPDNLGKEHGVKSMPDKNQEMDQISFPSSAIYNRGISTGSLDVGAFKTSGSASARTLLADDSEVNFMGRPSSRNTTLQGESTDEMKPANNEGSSKLLQSDDRNDVWPTVESLTPAEMVSTRDKILGVSPLPESERNETNRNTRHETNAPAAELKSHDVEADSRIGSERGSEPHTVRNVVLSSDVQGRGTFGKRTGAATYGFHGNDQTKRLLDLDRQLELYKKEAQDNATVEQLSSQLYSSGTTEKPNDLVAPSHGPNGDRLDILQTDDGGHLYLWMTDIKDTPANDSPLENKQPAGDIFMFNPYHDNGPANRGAGQRPRNEQLVPTERLSPLLSTGVAWNDEDVGNDDPMRDSGSPYQRRPQAPAPPPLFQSNLLKLDLGPGMERNNKMGNQQANPMGNQQDSYMGNQQYNQMDNQQANQMGQQQDNHMGNQRDNQMDNQQDKQMENHQDNQMGHQQDNHSGYLQDNQMDNQQDKQMENHQDNQIGNQPNKQFDQRLNQSANIQASHQGNQISTQQSNQESSPPNKPPGLTTRDEGAETQRHDNGRSSFLETLGTPHRHLDHSPLKPYQQLDAILTSPPQQLDAIIINPTQQLGPIITNQPEQLGDTIKHPPSAELKLTRDDNSNSVSSNDHTSSLGKTTDSSGLAPPDSARQPLNQKPPNLLSPFANLLSPFEFNVFLERVVFPYLQNVKHQYQPKVDDATGQSSSVSPERGRWASLPSGMSVADRHSQGEERNQFFPLATKHGLEDQNDQPQRVKMDDFNSASRRRYDIFPGQRLHLYNNFVPDKQSSERVLYNLYNEPGPRVHFNGLGPMNRFNEPSSMIFNEPNPITQFNDPNPMPQFNERNPMTQFHERNPMTQFKEEDLSRSSASNFMKFSHNNPILDQPFNLRPGGYQEPFNLRPGGYQEPFNLRLSGYQVATEIKPTGSHTESSPHGYVPYTQNDPYTPKSAPLQIWENRPRLSESYDTQQWVWLNGDPHSDPHKDPPTAEYRENSNPTMKELVDELLRSYSRKRHSNPHELNMSPPPMDRSILTHVPESSKLPSYDHLDHSNLPIFQSDASFSIPVDIGDKGANHQPEFPAQSLIIRKNFTPWEPPVGISKSKKKIPDNRSSLLTPQLYKARLSDGDIKPSLQARPKPPQDKDKHSRPFFSPRRHQTHVRSGSTKAEQHLNKTPRKAILENLNSGSPVDYNTPVTSTSRKQPTSDQHVPIPLSRYYRSRDSAHNNINSLNQRFRNKKLFLSQQFQMFNDEKFQVKKQMAGLEEKKKSRVQVLPWGISVQPQQNDLYELREGHSVELPSYLSRSPSPQFEPSFEPRDPGTLFGQDQSGLDNINTGLLGDEDNETSRQRAEIGPQQKKYFGSGVDIGTEHEPKAGIHLGKEADTEEGKDIGWSIDTVADNLEVAGIGLQINNSSNNFTDAVEVPDNSTNEIDFSLSRVNDSIGRGDNSSQFIAKPEVTMTTPPQTIDAAERNLSSMGTNRSDQRINDIRGQGNAMVVGQGEGVTSGAVRGSNTAVEFGSVPKIEEMITDLKLIREPMHTDSGHSAFRLKRDTRVIPWYKMGAVRPSSRAGGNDRSRLYKTRAKRENHITLHKSRVPLVAVNTASGGDKLNRKRRAVVKMAAYKTRLLTASRINDVTQNGRANPENIPSWISPRTTQNSPGATLINGDQTSDGGHGYQNNPGKYEQGAHRAPPGNLMPSEEQRTVEANDFVVTGNFSKTEELKYDTIADGTHSSQDGYRYVRLKETNTDRFKDQNIDRFKEQNIDIYKDQKIDRSMRSNQQNHAIDRMSARVTQKQSVLDEKQQQYNIDQQQESRAQKQKLTSQRGSDPEEEYVWSGLALQDSTNQNNETGTSDEPGGMTAPRGNSYADRYLQNQKVTQSTVSRQTRIHNPFVHTQGQLPYTDNSYPQSQAYTHKDQDTLASPDAARIKTDVSQRASPAKSRHTFQPEPADYPTHQGLSKLKQTNGPETANLMVSPDSMNQPSQMQTSYMDRFLSLKNPYGVAPTQPMVVHYQPYVMYYTYPYGYVSGDPSYTDEYNPYNDRYQEGKNEDKSDEEDKAGEEDKEEDEDKEKGDDEQSQTVYDNIDNQYTGTKQGYNDGYAGTKQEYTGGYAGIKQRYNDGYAGLKQGYNDGYAGTKGYTGGYAGIKQGYNDGYAGTKQGYNDGYADTKQGYTDGYAGIKQGYNDGYAGTKQGYNDGYAGTKQGYYDGYAGTEQGYNNGYDGTKQWYNDGYANTKQGYNEGYAGIKQGYNGGYAGTKQGYNGGYVGTKQIYNDGYAGSKQGYKNGYASIKQDYNDGYTSTKQSYRDKYFSTKKSYADGYTVSRGYGNTYPNNQRNGRTQVSNTGPTNTWLDKIGKKWNPNSHNNNVWDENIYNNNLWGKEGYNNNGWISDSKNNHWEKNNNNLGYWSRASLNTDGHNSYKDPVWGQNTYNTGVGQNSDYRNNYPTKGQYNPRFIRGTRKHGGKFLGRFAPNAYTSGSRYYQQGDLKSSTDQGDLKSSTGHDLDEDAVLQFVFAQKKFNSKYPGMTSNMGYGDSPSSSFYHVPDYGSKKSEMKGSHDDRVAEEAVEHFLYTKPRYGKKGDSLLGGILNI